MRQPIYVDYSDSGVKTTKGWATFFVVIGCISLLLAIIGFIRLLSEHYVTDDDLAAPLTGLLTSISAFIIAAILTAISSIAKTALFKRALLEQEYDFNQPKDNCTNTEHTPQQS